MDHSPDAVDLAAFDYLGGGGVFEGVVGFLKPGSDFGGVMDDAVEGLEDAVHLDDFLTGRFGGYGAFEPVSDGARGVSAQAADLWLGGMVVAPEALSSPLRPGRGVFGEA